LYVEGAFFSVNKEDENNILLKSDEELLAFIAQIIIFQ
jgi:hypothetical protein